MLFSLIRNAINGLTEELDFGLSIEHVRHVHIMNVEAINTRPLLNFALRRFKSIKRYDIDVLSVSNLGKHSTSANTLSFLSRQ